MPAPQVPPLIEDVIGDYFSHQSVIMINHVKNDYNILYATEYQNGGEHIAAFGDIDYYLDWYLDITITDPDNPGHRLVRSYHRRIPEGTELDLAEDQYVFDSMYEEPQVIPVNQEGGSVQRYKNRQLKSKSKSKVKRHATPKQLAALEKARAVKKLNQSQSQGGGWRW